VYTRCPPGRPFAAQTFVSMAPAPPVVGGGGGVGLALACIVLMVVFFAGLYLGRQKGAPEEKLGLGPVAGDGGPEWPVGGDEGGPGAWPNPGAWPAGGDGFEVARESQPPAACPDPDFSPLLTSGYPYNFSLESPDPVEVGENRMYSSAEVDPRVTGQLYAGARAAGVGRQFIYGNRVSFGDKWGMREFSTGVPGQTGVDVGPLGMCQYSLNGTPDVFDDGIPPEWMMPSTPPNWYKPKQRDYYNVETGGPSVYPNNLMPLYEPDHGPLFG
jgi:hypothetical protein